MIAYTWAHFLNDTSSPYWLARMPMTKAAVKAMDAMQEYSMTLSNPVNITGFMVAGASKRGWTTWTTGAVDKRVFAIVPVVMPILNMIPNMGEEYTNYGTWSFAIDDYINAGIMKKFYTPQMKELAAIVDPYSYVDRLTMPKLVIAATGDEFFLPDSPKWFWDKMQGESHLMMLPNCEHSCAGHGADISRAVETFFLLLVNDLPRPSFNFTLTYSNSSTNPAKIDVYIDPKNPPTSVKGYFANTMGSTYRDFRLLTCPSAKCIQPVIWFDMDVTNLGNGHYQAIRYPPATGQWTGFFVELDWEIGTKVGPYGTFKSTSVVNVVPDISPFPNCGPPVCDAPNTMSFQSGEPVISVQ